MQPALFNYVHPALSVSDVTRHIRQLIELDEILQDIWLEGEISNWSPAASGHIYFTLKDEGASMRCVIWRSSAGRLQYRPQGSGEAIRAHGRVSVYEAGGAYQFYVDDIEPAGQGALYAQFERLKQQLAEEGLFDPERKLPLPPLANRIGIVTSGQAAALRDVINVLSRRYPLAEVILSPSPVQGIDAPPKIVAALERLIDHEPAVDVILLVRGGGSIEDLWAFNNDAVAYAIDASPIPIVTGVGHETDFTIADFVADYRAPTPSAAAEVVTPDALELKRQLEATQLYLLTHANDLLEGRRMDLQDSLRWLTQLSPQRQIDGRRQQVDDIAAGLERTMAQTLVLSQAQLASSAARLKALSPSATLARGYAIVRKGGVRKQGEAVTSIGQVAAGDKVNITLKDGDFEAEVEKSND